MTGAKREAHVSPLPPGEGCWVRAVRNPRATTGRGVVLAAALALLAGLAGRAARASDGSLHTTAGFGLRMDVDTRWLAGNGYRPVRVRVTPTTPPTADRTLQLQFVARRSWRGAYDLQATQFVEVPAGAAAPIETVMSVPEYGGWQSYQINVFEGGVQRESLGVPWSSQGGRTGWEEGFPNILFVGDGVPDTSSLMALFPSDQFGRPWGMVTSVIPTGLPSCHAESPGDLPPRWIDYTSVDVVCLSVESLGKVRARNTSAFEAIRRWVAAGGNLWVYGLGAEWQELGEVEDFVKLPPGTAGSGEPAERGWAAPNEKLRDRPPRGAMYSEPTYAPGYYPGMDPETSGEADAELIPLRRKPPADPGKPIAFLTRPVEQGLVVAIAEAAPFPGAKEDWQWVLNAMGSERWLWYQRHGITYARDNRDFWNFLIPGVGLAPVVEFCTTITLFVLAIGPVNYLLLRRWRRLDLLVVTVPGGAAAVTLLLFGYAVVADGLGTRVRARSITHLDQRSGEAVCWARLSYYAGLAPGGGLVFPEDTAVFPLDHLPMRDYQDRALRRRLVWDDGQHLASGWLSSRTPTQFVAVRSRATTAGIDVAEPKRSGGKPAVTNRLGSRIEELMVTLEDGATYWAAGVEPGATAALEPIEPAEARGGLRTAMRKVQPALPPGMDPQSYSSIFGFNRRYRYYYWGYSDANFVAATQATNRLEQGLSGVAPTVGRFAAPPPPRSYTALVARSPEVELGTPGAKEESSLHVILGKW
jgi:hypothetical protein